jgi:hypothetical protein
MFNIAKTVSDYTWPVQVQLPTDGGRHTTETFDARFKRISQTDVQELKSAIQAGTITDVELCSQVLVGWEGIKAGEDPVPYSESARAQLLDIPGVAYAVVMAFLESIAGAKRKN